MEVTTTMQSVIQEFTIGFFDSSGVFSIYMKRDDTNRIVKFHIVDNAEDYREFIKTHVNARDFSHEMKRAK